MKIANRYFKWSNKKQKQFQIKLAIGCLILIVSLGVTLFYISSKLMFLLLFVVVLIIQLIAPFFDVPSLVKKGQLKYYSLFFLAEKEKEKIVKVHGGTLFDYYFVFRKEMTAKERERLVLLEYLKGLIKLSRNANENSSIEGTSYIINERTANKVGLVKVTTNGIQKIILIFNYINLMASIFLVKKSLDFPNLGKIITVRGKVKDVRAREPYINQLIDKLEKTIVDNK